MTGAHGIGQTVPAITNQTFLQTFFGALWREAHVTSFMGDPGAPPPGAWSGGKAGRLLATFDHRLNNYFVVSTFTSDRRIEGQFKALYVLLVDDVGTKVPPARAWDLMGEPTYRLETSPGNAQWGYALSPPWTSLAAFQALQGALTGFLTGGGKDPGHGGVTRYARLPVGTNTKPSLGPDGYACRLITWNPSARLTREGVTRIAVQVGIEEDALRALEAPAPHQVSQAEGAGLSGQGPAPFDDQDPDPAHQAHQAHQTPLAIARSNQANAIPDPEDTDPLFRAMGRLGLIRRGPRNSPMGRGYDIVCPWVHEHTDRAESGTFYVPGKGTFQCHHGHCQDKGPDEVKDRVDEMLREAFGEGLVHEDMRDTIDPATVPAPPQGVRKKRQAQSQNQTGVKPTQISEATEDALALQFAKRFETVLRFDHDVHAWFVWDDARWQQDGTEMAFSWARREARNFRRSATKEYQALGKISVAAAIERAARADERLAVRNSVWNPDKWRIAAVTTEIDLRDGSLHKPEPKHMITMQVSVDPAPPGTPTPLWDKFMDETFGGDADVIAFMHQWFGYSLSGDVSAEMFAFLWGTGGNGKGVLLHTMMGIAHEYALKVDSNIFVKQKFTPHPTEIAQLAGKRMVVSSEVSDEAAFDLDRLKELTGHESMLSGRFMRQDYFQFPPELKLTIVGNHKPTLSHVDNAVRRRFILIPFTHTPTHPDPTLKARLVTEYPGILRKLIDGAATVHGALVGLGASLADMVPAVAAAASEDYFDDQDPITAWVRARCDLAHGERTGVTEAYQDHDTWARNEGRRPFPWPRKFSGAVVSAFPGCQVIRTDKGAVIVGLKLRPDDDDMGDEPF